MNLIIDVSNNDPITLAEFKSSGSKALICKATEGTTFQDTTLATHRAIAKDAHVPFGSYLFLHPGSKGSEAAYYLSYAKPGKGDIQPIIDAEVADGETIAKAVARVQSCARALEAEGYAPILYASADFWKSIFAVEPSLKRLPVWEADYPGKFTRWLPSIAALRIKLQHGATVVMWQWTDRYAVGTRRYDASRLFVDLDAIRIAL